MSFVRRYWLSAVAVLASAVVFLVPFAFIILTSVKNKQEAALLDFTWPTSFHLWDNMVEVITTRNWMLVTAFINSTILTVASVTLLVIFSAMVGFVLQRRKTRWNGVINFLILAWIIFLMVRAVNTMRRQMIKEKPLEPAAPPPDIALLTEIRDLLAKRPMS